MSKKSVFKFDFKNEKKEIVESIIISYLERNQFVYNDNANCYVIGNLSEKDIKMDMATTMVSNIQPYYVVNYNFRRCFEYEILDNQLIIKACILNTFTNGKTYIHSNINSTMEAREYYKDLKYNLFKSLEENIAKLSSIEIEKVKDGSTSKLIKFVLSIIIPIIIVFTIITIYVYCTTH